MGHLLQADRETRLRNEYLQIAFPGASIATNVPLGTIPPEVRAQAPRLSERAFNPSRRRCDAVVRTELAVYVIDFTIEWEAEALGRFPLYRELLRNTPDLPFAIDRPVRYRLVTTRETPSLRNIAHDLGVELIVFAPGWLVP